MARDVLISAWRLARRGAARFGGRPAQYLRCALQLVWAERGKALRGVRRVLVAAQDTCRRTLHAAQDWVAATRVAQAAKAWYVASMVAIGAAETEKGRRWARWSS